MLTTIPPTPHARQAPGAAPRATHARLRRCPARRLALPHRGAQPAPVLSWPPPTDAPPARPDTCLGSRGAPLAELRGRSACSAWAGACSQETLLPGLAGGRPPSRGGRREGRGLGGGGQASGRGPWAWRGARRSLRAGLFPGAARRGRAKG